MIANQTRSRKLDIHLYIGVEFEETLNLFEAMVKKDKNILNNIPDNLKNIVKKNGMLSFAIKDLIANYVKINKKAFLVKYGQSAAENNS